MYPDLYKRLNLRPEDLTAYNSPLVSFEGNIVISKGQIRLPIQTGSKMVEVDFFVVDAYSPYIAIVARPQFHALGTVSSTLHQKVKYLLGGQVKKIVRSLWLGNACWPPSHIGLKLSPQPLLKGAHSNQKLRRCQTMDQPKRQSAKIQKGWLLVMIQRSSFKSGLNCLPKREKS